MSVNKIVVTQCIFKNCTLRVECWMGRKNDIQHRGGFIIHSCWLVDQLMHIICSFNIMDICNRASRQINSFRRFAKYLKIDRRLSVYKTFIQSNFSYCPLAWIFCGRKNSNKLEKLQERSLRIVFDDFSTSDEILCERANTLPLSFYRIRFLGIEMYKCVNGFNPTYLNDLFTAQSNDYNLRDSSRLIQPKFNTFKFGFKSFRYFGAKLWNVLPINIKRSESLSIFKISITAWCHSDAAKALERKIF